MHLASTSSFLTLVKVATNVQIQSSRNVRKDMSVEWQQLEKNKGCMLIEVVHGLLVLREVRYHNSQVQSMTILYCASKLEDGNPAKIKTDNTLLRTSTRNMRFNRREDGLPVHMYCK